MRLQRIRFPKSCSLFFSFLSTANGRNKFLAYFVDKIRSNNLLRDLLFLPLYPSETNFRTFVLICCLRNGCIGEIKKGREKGKRKRKKEEQTFEKQEN